MFKLIDYNYILPEDRIAQHPISPAHESKLLSCRLQPDNTISLSDYHCYDLPKLLPGNTLLIANNSQTFSSRIPLSYTKVLLKDNQEIILISWEIFIVRVLFDDDGNLITDRCIIRWSDKKHFKPWSTIFFNNNQHGISQSFVDDGILFQLYNIDVIHLCEQYGDMPLPPYITQATLEDKLRYKTTFWQQIGSVATPTAGLHFTEQLRNDLKNKKIDRTEITLHVGIGTFAPVVSDDIRNHNLHAEYITIDRSLWKTIAEKKQLHHPIITIGTTSTRTIESLPYLRQLLPQEQKEKYCDTDTRQRWDTQSMPEWNSHFLLLVRSDSRTMSFTSSLFIFPWFERKIIDGIITNFHLPQTSLVMLVAGLMWYDNRKKSYEYALSNNYRFASFGDAMFISLPHQLW